jgi:hypothetical protein
MHVLLFDTRANGAIERLQDLADEHECVERVELVQSVEGLNLRLRSPAAHPDLVVLAVNRKKELAELFALGELLSEIRLVLVLPDREPGTVAMAHRLRPRFVSYTDGDPSVLAAVVLKIVTGAEPAEVGG